MRKLLILLALFALCGVIAQGQSPYSGWYFSAKATQNGFVLDKIQMPAVAAFSLRKLREGYTGFAIRVRRSSDNTEQNIGFDDDGNFNVFALSTFVGSSSGFIVTWYDQSGNIKDVTQATQADQPRIVNVGAVDQMGGRPSPRGDGTDYLQGSDAFSGSAAEFELYAVLNIYQILNGTNGNNLFVLNDSPRFLAAMPWADGNIYFDAGSFNSPQRLAVSGQISQNVSYQFTLANSVANSLQSVRRNGTTVGSDASGHSVSTNLTRISSLSPNGVQGHYPEMIFFNRILTANERQVVEDNQKSYYGL